MRRTEWLAGVAYLLALTALSLMGHWTRSSAERTCAHDGEVINPLYRVRIVDDHGRDNVFCCIHCAQSWLQHQSTPLRAIWVTDETSGEEIEAASASFVRSAVLTNPSTLNRIHVFRSPSDAEEHARACNGRLLDATETPFPDGECPACPECAKSAHAR
jgi:hypothetical protein